MVCEKATNETKMKKLTPLQSVIHVNSIYTGSELGMLCNCWLVRNRRATDCVDNTVSDQQSVKDSNTNGLVEGELLVEGDIKVKIGRNVRCPECSWKKSPNGIVQVPYLLSILYTLSQQASIAQALDEFKTMTCIQFIPRTSEPDYLYIDPSSKCWSYIGKIGGQQDLGLAQVGCLTYARIQHEFMHSLGFYHEQNRIDRDDYIEVLWDNILSGGKANYEIEDGNTMDLPYDYMSTMHFDMYDYSISPTIPTYYIRSYPSLLIASKLGMDNMDIKKLNTLYNCTERCRAKFVDPSGTLSYDSNLAAQSSSRCLWLIQTTDLVLLQVNDINIPQSPGCSNGYIKIYDGLSTSSPVLWEKSCGNMTFPPLVSSGTFMLLEVTNNLLKSMRSFNASYETIKFGGVYTARTGIVKSPLFPNFPAGDTRAIWTIITPSGCKISLMFTIFWIRSSDGCSTDYLLIKDGSVKKFPVLGKYCGFITTLAPIVSASNVMIIQYQKSNLSDARGFMLTYFCA